MHLLEVSNCDLEPMIEETKTPAKRKARKASGKIKKEVKLEDSVKREAGASAVKSENADADDEAESTVKTEHPSM